MFDFMSSNNTLMLERSSSFLWTRQTALLDNIVNAETPNYKVKTVTFEEALRSRIQAANKLDQAAGAQMRAAITTTSPVIRRIHNESARMDENGVNVSEQIMELVRNTYQMQYTFNSFNSNMARLMAAIQG